MAEGLQVNTNDPMALTGRQVTDRRPSYLPGHDAGAVKTNHAWAAADAAFSSVKFELNNVELEQSGTSTGWKRRSEGAGPASS